MKTTGPGRVSHVELVIESITFPSGSAMQGTLPTESASAP
jgi:hypothetical protein